MPSCVGSLDLDTRTRLARQVIYKIALNQNRSPMWSLFPTFQEGQRYVCVPPLHPKANGLQCDPRYHMPPNNLWHSRPRYCLGYRSDIWEHTPSATTTIAGLCRRSACEVDLSSTSQTRRRENQEYCHDMDCCAHLVPWDNEWVVSLIPAQYSFQ